jgi:rhodanese-related sulfurtransferase
MKKVKHIITLIVAIVSITLFAQETSKQADQQLSFEAFETKLKQASSNAQIVDVRTDEEFKRNHLKGAVQLDITNETDVKNLLSKLDKNKPVFVYSINNGRSISFVKTLKEQQFKDAYFLPGGIAKWVGAGKPVETTTTTGISINDYKKELVSDKLVLVEVGSKYCGGCAKLVPVVETVDKENPGKLKVVKVELFDNKQLGKELNIQSIPTLILYKGEKIVWQKNGAITKEDIETAIHHDYATN